MSLMTATAESLSAEIGAEVNEIHLLVAKNSIAGLGASEIAEVLGVSQSDVAEIQSEETYKAVRLLLATDYSRQQLTKDFGWDDIEATALKNLAKRVGLERDTETLLRIAAVANKAQRRMPTNQKDVLDPSAGGTRVALNLTQRITERLQNGATRSVERQISVLDGSAKNPSFDDIDKMFGVTAKPALPSVMKFSTHEPDFTVDDLKFPE
jgi:predicted XRE-type DNA-binding protein